MSSQVRKSTEELLKDIPEAVWSPGKPEPFVYRGTPIDMVRQMASEIGPAVTEDRAIDVILGALAHQGRLRLRITGNPPTEIRSVLFIYALLQHGICYPMPQA